MRKKIPLFVGASLILILALSIPSYAASTRYSQDNQKMLIATTHPILASLIKLVGGDYVDIVEVIPPGVDPHEYEPPLDIMRKIASSDVIIIDSLHHLPISDKIYELYSDRSIVILDKLLSSGWTPEKIPGTDVENLHEVFLDEEALLLSIRIISQILSDVAENKGFNITGYISIRSDMLENLVKRSFDQARRDAKDLGIADVALYSPVLYYLIRSVGINVSTILTPDPEVEPSPKYLQNLGSSASRCLLVASDLEHVDINRLSASANSLGIRVVSVEIASRKDPEDLLLLPSSILVRLSECVRMSGGAASSGSEDRFTAYLLLAGVAVLALAVAILALLFREKRGGRAP